MPINSEEVFSTRGVVAMRKVFDAHFHIGHWGQRRLFGREVCPLLPSHDGDYIPGQEHEDYRDVQRYLTHYDIFGGLVMCNFLGDDPRYSLIDLNKVALEAAHKCENVYTALFVSPRGEDWDYTREAMNMAKSDPNVKAIKMTPTHWDAFSPDPTTWSSEVRNNFEDIFKFAEDKGLVIQFHSGLLNAEPLLFDSFLKEYGSEGIRLYLVHSGETCYPGMQYTTLIREWLDKGYQVYSDVSLAPGFVMPKLLSVLCADEVEHIMFATDAPWGNFASEVAKIEDLSISEDIKQKIFYDNAIKLFGL